MRLDELVQGLADPGVFVRGVDEGVAFLGEGLGGALGVGVDETDDFESGPEFAGGMRFCVRNGDGMEGDAVLTVPA